MFPIRATVQKLFSALNSPQINTTQVRTKVRYHLPKPTEVKRFRKQGLLKKLETPQGRRLLQQRILKGDFVIAH